MISNGNYRETQGPSRQDSRRFELRHGLRYQISYCDASGEHHEMTATFLGDTKFRGTSWSFRPLAGTKNLAPGALLRAVAQPMATV